MSYKEEALNPHNKFVLKDGVIKIDYGDEETTILRNHYEWCKKENRDVSWYKEYKEGKNVRVEAPKVLQGIKKK